MFFLLPAYVGKLMFQSAVYYYKIEEKIHSGTWFLTTIYLPFCLFYKSKNVKRAAFLSILILNNIPSVSILSMKTAQLENTSDHQNLYDSQKYSSLAIRTGLGEW